MAWPYQAPPNAAVFTSRRVVKREAKVVRVIRDEDGDWQALDAAPRAVGDGALLALEALVELHPDVAGAVAALDTEAWGWQARRSASDGWEIGPLL